MPPGIGFEAAFDLLGGWGVVGLSGEIDGLLGGLFRLLEESIGGEGGGEGVENAGMGAGGEFFCAPGEPEGFRRRRRRVFRGGKAPGGVVGQRGVVRPPAQIVPEKMPGVVGTMTEFPAVNALMVRMPSDGGVSITT